MADNDVDPQELIRQLLARNQALEQQLQQTRQQDALGNQSPLTQLTVEAPEEPDKSATVLVQPSPPRAAKRYADDDDAKSRTCVDCDKTFPTLKALNRCSTCYQRLYKRRRRAMAQQHKTTHSGGNPTQSNPMLPIPQAMGFNPPAPLPDMMVAMQQLQANVPPMQLGVPPPATTGATDDRLLLLLRIRALLEDSNRPEGDGRLTDIEGLLTSYMRMEEAGRDAAGGAPSTNDGSGTKPSAGETFEGAEGEDGGLERVANPDWESMPGTCNPNTEKAKTSRRRLRQVEVLLAVGLLHEGDVLKYKSRSGKIMAQGVVKGTGILCSRCNQLVGATEFEQCAGSGLRRPCENIYTADNLTLQDLLVQADKIMLDRSNTTPAVDAPKPAAAWVPQATGPAAFAAPAPLLPAGLPAALPQLAGQMDLNALRQAAYGSGAAAAALGMAPAFAAGQFADPATLQSLQAMFGGGDDSTDDGDSSGAEGDVPQALQGLAGMLQQPGGLSLQGFGRDNRNAGLAANMLMEQYAALYVNVKL